MDTYYEKIERLNDNKFLKNIKSFGYFKTNYYRELMRFVDSAHYQVYIMGHSCGLSDRILLNSIFEHDNCQSIQIYYHQIGKNHDDFHEKTQEISRHFRANKKGKMRTLIIPHHGSIPLVRISS